MKKLLALAVAGAFVAPVYADISITGSMEMGYNTAAGISRVAQDSNVNVNASTETANGLKVSSSIRFTGHAAAIDNGNSLSIGGAFGTVGLGDVNSAADRFKGKNDYAYVYGTGLTAPDASIGWTLPSFVPNLTVYLSHSAEAQTGAGDAPSHTGVALNYSAGPVVLSAGQNQNDDNTKVTYSGISATFAGVTVAFEKMQDDDATTKLDESSIGAEYKMGDLTLHFSSQETKENDAVDSDVTAMGLSYSLGGGVVAFVEMADDDRAANAEMTSVGVTFKF